MDLHRKDPERVRLGRLGALTLHAAGKTNTGPARRAWEAKIAAEIDPDGALAPDELARRMRYAIRARMTRLAMARWAKKTVKAGTTNSRGPIVHPAPAAPRSRPSPSPEAAA